MILAKGTEKVDHTNDIPKVSFSATHSALPGVTSETRKLWEMLAEQNPVVPTSSVLPEWYNKLKKEYENDHSKIHVKRDGTPYTQDTHPTVKKCPGIFDFLRAGYIVPAWSDFAFNWDGTNNQPEFQASYAMRELAKSTGVMQHSPYYEGVVNHEYPQAEGAPFWDNSCKDILKLISPWCVDTSEGISLMILQPYYHNSTDYTIMPGILDSDVNVINNKQLQVFVKINVPNRDIFIQRGTPLLQIIPFKRTDFKFECITRPTEDMIRDFEVLGMDVYSKIQGVPESKAEKISKESKCPFGHSVPNPNHRNKTMVHNRKQDGKNYNKKD